MPHEALHPSEQPEIPSLKITANTRNPVTSMVQRSVRQGVWGFAFWTCKSIFKSRNLPQIPFSREGEEGKKRQLLRWTTDPGGHNPVISLGTIKPFPARAHALRLPRAGFLPRADTRIKAQVQGWRRSRGGPEHGAAPRDSRALTGVVEGDLPAPGGGPGAVVHRSSFHDVRLRGVGFGSSHQDTDPAKHTGRSPGRSAGTGGRWVLSPSGETPPFARRLPAAFPGWGRPGPAAPARHSRAGVRDVEVHRVPEVAARGPAVHRQLLLVQVESHQRRRPEQRWQEEQRVLPAAGPPAAEGQHPRRLRCRPPLAQRSAAVRRPCGAGRRGASAVRCCGVRRGAERRSGEVRSRCRRARAGGGAGGSASLGPARPPRDARSGAPWRRAAGGGAALSAARCPAGLRKASAGNSAGNCAGNLRQTPA